MLKGNCFEVFDTENDEWNLCAESAEEKTAWVTAIMTAIGEPLGVALNETAEQEETIKQPVLLLPLPSPWCNEGWNYQDHGDSWECICKEGFEQTSGCMSMREFRTRERKSTRKKMKRSELDLNRSVIIDWTDMQTSDWEMVWEDNMIKIKSKNGATFGTAEDIDFLEYEGREILFHTPSDHTINGENFPMEIQAVFYPANDRSFRFKLVVSWVVKIYAGSENNFTNKIDLLNLPNQIIKKKKFTNDSDVLNLKNMFYTYDMEEFSGYFNYFYYQGSLTYPPCDEHVRWVVVENPVELGNTFVEMFKDAMTKVPSVIHLFYLLFKIIDATTGEEAVVSPKMRAARNPTGTNRNIQNLNIRKIYHFDVMMSPCKYPRSKYEEEEKPYGHYESLPADINSYIYVPGKQPSGFPGAVEITQREAKGEKKKEKEKPGVFSNGI